MFDDDGITFLIIIIFGCVLFACFMSDKRDEKKQQFELDNKKIELRLQELKLQELEANEINSDTE